MNLKRYFSSFTKIDGEFLKTLSSSRKTVRLSLRDPGIQSPPPPPPKISNRAA